MFETFLVVDFGEPKALHCQCWSALAADRFDSEVGIQRESGQVDEARQRDDKDEEKG